MSDPDSQAAINAALNLNWDKAIELNKKILNQCPNDVDCLNRLGRALVESGNTKKASSIFRQVLKISKYDPIAIRNLTRLNQIGTRKQNSPAPNPTLVSFLEEPGKTKMIALINVASSKNLLPLNLASPVSLTIKRHTVLITSPDGVYLGALPDDLGHRLLILMKGGNKYAGFVKSVTKNSLCVFIRETLRAKKFHNTPSFPTNSSDYLSFIRDESAESGHQPAAESDEENSDGEEVTFTKAEKIHQDEIPEEQ